jgi:Glycosyl hydrolase-like 10
MNVTKLGNVGHLLMAAMVTTGLMVNAGTLPALAQTAPYCQQSPDAIAQKETLRQAMVRGDRGAQKRYNALLKDQGDRLRACRQKTWTQDAALWIRLYPCDAQNGVLDQVLDRIVNRGYTRVYVNVFYNSKVLLPANVNPTAWDSVQAGTRAQNADLLAQAIQKGHARGLKVYAWLFSMNFGAQYFSRTGKAGAIARNGYGQTSLSAREAASVNLEADLNALHDEAFIDPYNVQARQDYGKLVQAVIQRKPDGVLFDYIRYQRGRGPASVAQRVQDLWIYSSASQQALLQRALNNKGRDLIWRYVNQGGLTLADLKAVNQQYPTEAEPLWQGRNGSVAALAPDQQVAQLQFELWQLAVAHAAQGVVDYLADISAPVQRAGIATGAVFFPDGNQTVGSGYDSRLQFWHRFPRSMEWHPMAYGVCGKTDCIMSQVFRILRLAPPGTRVEPVLAGIWQQPISNRPPLEVQIQALQQAVPDLRAMSHFAYSWQEPGSDRDRKSCQP